MKNTDIFSPSEGYDMVVSVTQQTINDQLATLANPDIGIIKTSILFGLQRNAKKERVAKFFDKWSDVPQESDGTPTIPVISAEYLPQIQITASGSIVALVLELNSGFAWFVDPVDGSLNKTEIADWKYGIAIDLDFAGIDRDALKSGIPAPGIVIDRLNNFIDADFKISQLFVNLTDVNLIRSDPEITTVGTSSPDVLDTFTLFMAAFLRAIQDNPKDNPFILGYSIAKPTSNPDDDKDVPPTLKPIGQTFTVYHDVTNDNLSNVNFCLNTKGGQSSLGNGTHATPGTFDSNWIGGTEQCDAKMIYSLYSLLETLILKPFYDGYSSNCYDTIHNSGVNISNPPVYASAVQSLSYGKNYNISNVTDGDDQYINQYKVLFDSSGGQITMRFSGGLSTRKTVNKDEGFCTATAWASGYVNWECTMTIKAEKDSNGKPVLNVSKPVPNVTSQDQNSDENTCAKAFSWIGKILGSILDAFTLGLDNGFFAKLFDTLMSPTLPQFYNVDDALRQMGTTINGSFVLPAGQEFFFKNPVADDSGNLSLELTYKTETGKLMLTHSPTEMVEGPICRRTKLSVKKQEQSSDKKLAHSLLKGTEHATPNPNAQPLFDDFKFSALESSEDAYDVNVSCELMTNSTPGMPVVPTQEFSLAQDVHGNALIFALGSDGHFNILIGQSGTNGIGFKVINIGQDFTGYKSAVCFAVHQEEDGKISVAFVLSDSNDVQAVFYAPMLSNDLGTTDFSRMSQLATQVTGFDDEFRAQKMQVGSSADGHRPDLVVVGQLKGQKFFYQLQAGDMVPSQVSFPENVFENLISMKTGYAFADRANVFLYEQGASMSLVSKTIATASKKSVVFDYSPGNTDLPVAFQDLEYNSINTVVSRTGRYASSDILITAATGVYRIPNGKAARMECITDKILDGREIFAATTATTISLWVVASPNILWYISGNKQEGGSDVTWGTPIQFAKGVIHVAGMRSFVNNANEIFTVNQDLSIKRYWQDPVTTNWSSKTEVVPKSNYVVNYNSYTTQIHVEQAGVPLAGAKLLASSSEWQYYAINGLIYSLDKDTTAELTTDAQGNVTIIGSAIDIAPCILHVQSPLFKETMNIYPNGKLNHHLSGITDGESLRQATTQDGKPVMESGIDTTVSDGVADNISQVKTNAGDNLFMPAKQGHIFTAIETPTAKGDTSHVKHSAMASLDVKDVKPGVLCGMTVVNGKWQPHEEGQAAQLAKESLLSSSFGDALGDFWHWLENFGETVISTIEKGIVKLKDGATFLIHKVEEGLEFVLKTADGLFRIALNALSAVFKALTWILKLVGIDLAKILAWIGHLLGWDHIWATHQMLSGMSKAFVDFATSEGVAYIEQARGSVKALFSTINVEVRNSILPDSIQNDKQSVAANSADRGSDARSVASSGPTNYSYYQLQHGVGSTSPSPTTNDTVVLKSKAIGDSPFMQFYNDVVEPAFQTISDRLGTTADDLLKLLKDLNMQNLKVLIADIADLIISVIGTVVDGFLKFAEDILKDLAGILEEELDIPIIGALWDFICDLFGSSEPLTVLNAVSLMLAIPATTAIKLATGTTPDQMNQGFDQPGFPAKVQAWLNGKQEPKSALLDAHDEVTQGKGEAEGFQCPPELKWFSVFEGTLAPFAAIAATVASIAKANGVENSYLEKFEVGCGVVKALISWPVPDDDQDWAMYTVRWVAWLLSTAADLIPKVPAEAKAVINVILAILAIVVDAIEGQDALAWVSDLGGTICSVVAEAGNKDPEISIPGYAASILFGSLVAFAGGVAKFVLFSQPNSEALMAATGGNKKVWKSINVGGA